MREIVAEGVWCGQCEFFEVPDFDPDNGQCLACGCSEKAHSEVEVVTKG